MSTLLAAKQAGKTKLGIPYCAEAPSCPLQVEIDQRLAKAIGGITVTGVKVSSTAPNYTAPCLELKGQGVDAIFPSANGSVIQRLMAACIQQGYKPLLIVWAGTLTPTQFKDPNLQAR